MANAGSPSSRLWFQQKVQGPLFGDRYHVASESSRRWLEVVDGLLAGSIRERDAMRAVAGLIDLFDRAFCKAMSRDRWGEELERNPEYKKSWERQNEGARAAGFRAMPRCWTKLDQRFVERLDGKRTDDWPRRRVDRIVGYCASWLSSLQPIAERAVETSGLPAPEDLQFARVTVGRLGVYIPELVSAAKEVGLGVDGFEKACTVVLGLRRLAPTLRFLSFEMTRNDMLAAIWGYAIRLSKELRVGEFTATGNAYLGRLGTIRDFRCPVNKDREFDVLRCLADYEACLASDSIVSARLTDLESLLHRLPFNSPFRGKLNSSAGEPIWDAKVAADRLFDLCEGIRSHFDFGLFEQVPASQPSESPRRQDDERAPGDGLYEDDRVLVWCGKRVTLTSNQAILCRLLYDAFGRGTYDVSEETIIDRTGVARVANLLRSSKTDSVGKRGKSELAALIVKGPRQDLWRLVLPPSDSSDR